MNGRAFFVLWVFALAVPALAAPRGAWIPSPQKAEQARRAVQAAYARMAAAATQRDVEGFFAFKTPDFVSVSADGQEAGLGQQRMAMGLVLKTAQSIKARVKIVAFKLVGDGEARATVQDHTEMRFKRPDDHVATMIVDTVAEATWIKTAQGWREKRSRSIRERGTLDGKPLARPGSQP